MRLHVDPSTDANTMTLAKSFRPAKVLCADHLESNLLLEFFILAPYFTFI